MKFTFEKKATLFYYLAVIFITSILTFLYYNSEKALATNKLLVHTQKVINKNNEVLLNAVNIETGFRGYLLSGDSLFLEPYTNSKMEIYANLDSLYNLTDGKPIQQNRVDLLKQSIDDRLLFTKKNMLLYNQSNFNNAQKKEIIDEGKKITDKIRKLIASINKDERLLFKKRQLDSEKNNNNTNYLFILLLLSLITVFVLIISIISNQKKRNTDLLAFTNTQKRYSRYTLSLIEASLDPLVTINAEGKITDLNDATVQITGVSRSTLKGSDFFDYFTEQQKAREVYQEVFDKGSVADLPLTIRHKDGKLTDVLFNGSVYKDEYGNVLGVVIVARDIAEQKWALDLRIANKELAFQNDEKEKRAAELAIANEELAFQNNEKEKRANELLIANEELEYQNNEKEKRAEELLVANEELEYQNNEKEKRAEELLIANKELEYQNKVKEKRAAELVIANKELAFQNDEKEKRAAELVIANKELLFQKGEKQSRAAELVAADKELYFQNIEKEKRIIENAALEAYSYSLKLASQYSLSLIEASRDPLFTISTEGKITDTNQAAARVTEVAKNQLIGSDFFDYFTSSDKARELYELVFTNGFIVDYPLTIVDGNLTDVIFNGSVYKDENGKVLGAVVVARDITEQKRIERELIEAKVFAELATSIAQKEKANAEEAKLLAEQAVKSKQQFLSNMSHEIRTPMNAIIGFTKVVLKTELTAKQKEYLTAIKMSGDALIVLINDILDLAKVDAGKMSFEKIPFKMNLSIVAMLHLFETKIQEKNLKLVTHYDQSIPEVLIGDPVRLHQIILNLVSNAVKFTSKGKITVDVKLIAETDDDVTVKFDISDTGIGIEKEKMSSIFENFQQATSGTSRIFGGTGLGLAIVKHLVEAQNGTISVSSKIDKGATFSFELKFQKTDVTLVLEPEIMELNTDIKDTKVLVAEDMELNQLLMKTVLDDFGFDCDIASNGQIAIDKLKKKSYDIILMDLQMPEMNGFEATEYIRKTMKLKTPIIALTADVTTVDVNKCKAVGMNDYISKPIDERLLYSKLIGLIKKPVVIIEQEIVDNVTIEKIKYVDMTYLVKLTKSNPVLMSEMISAYLKQTPPLITTMKQSFRDKDWHLLHATVHKLIPSFSIMGINPSITLVAKKVQEYANTLELSEELNSLVLELETVCNQACEELQIEINNLNK